MTIEGKPTLSEDTYVKYSLEQLSVWVRDAMDSTSPEVVAKTIIDTIREEMDYHNTKYDEYRELRDALSSSFVRYKNNFGHYDGWDNIPDGVAITEKPDYDDIEETTGDSIIIQSSDC